MKVFTMYLKGGQKSKHLSVQKHRDITVFFYMFIVSCVSADQVYGDQEMHGTVRKHCIDYMVSSLAMKILKTNKKILF